MRHPPNDPASNRVRLIPGQAGLDLSPSIEKLGHGHSPSILNQGRPSAASRSVRPLHASSSHRTFHPVSSVKMFREWRTWQVFGIRFAFVGIKNVPVHDYSNVQILPLPRGRLCLPAFHVDPHGAFPESLARILMSYIHADVQMRFFASLESSRKRRQNMYLREIRRHDRIDIPQGPVVCCSTLTSRSASVVRQNSSSASLRSPVHLDGNCHLPMKKPGTAIMFGSGNSSIPDMAVVKGQGNLASASVLGRTFHFQTDPSTDVTCLIAGDHPFPRYAGGKVAGSRNWRKCPPSHLANRLFASLSPIFAGLQPNGPAPTASPSEREKRRILETHCRHPRSVSNTGLTVDRVPTSTP